VLRDGRARRRWLAASDAAGELLAQVQDDLGEGPSLAAYAGGQAVAVADLGADPRWAGVGAVVGQLSVRSVLSVPVAGEAAPLGTLDLYRRDRHDWTDAEADRARELAAVVTGLLGVAAERSALAARVAQLERALARRDDAAPGDRRARTGADRAADRLARLQALAEGLARAGSAQQVARLVVGEAVRALGASAGLVGVVDGAGLRLVASAGYAAAELDPWRRIPLDAPQPLAEAARDGTAIWLPGPAELQARHHGLALPGRHQALAAVGLVVDGRPFGVLGLGFAGPRGFPEEDRRFLHAVAGHGAQALQRVSLLEEARANGARVATALHRAIAAERRAVAAQEQALAARRHAAHLTEASVLLAGTPGAVVDGEQPLRA
jgi:GAF domain-containing protein